jgi:tetratricopeptide (TPR) repeat protein
MTFIAFVALAMSVGEAGAAERFRPVAPEYVVLRVPARATNDPIAILERRHSQQPEDQRVVAELAGLYVQRARTQREARFFGRAEVLLQPWVVRADASAATLRVQADILQNRHDFAGALKLLDVAIERDSRDVGARLMRASVYLVEGRAMEARRDCAVVLAAGESAAGTACLAQVLGDTGKLAQAESLLKDLQSRGDDLSADMRGWVAWLQADFADRRGDARRSEMFLREALQATPFNEGVRSALADVLIARGALREAVAVVDVPAPSLGLLARRARAQKALGESSLEVTREQISDLLNLASRRGERPHLREEALIAMEVDGDLERALSLAKANFEVQRETLDARLLTRAARARGDREGLDIVARWMRDTGFEDAELGGLRTCAQGDMRRWEACSPRSCGSWSRCLRCMERRPKRMRRVPVISWRTKPASASRSPGMSQSPMYIGRWSSTQTGMAPSPGARSKIAATISQPSRPHGSTSPAPGTSANPDSSICF